MGGGGRRFGLNRQYSVRGCKAVEEGVDGKNEKAVRKPKEHAERDPKNKPKPVWLQVGNPKGPYLFKFFQRVDILAIVTP